MKIKITEDISARPVSEILCIPAGRLFKILPTSSGSGPSIGMNLAKLITMDFKFFICANALTKSFSSQFLR